MNKILMRLVFVVLIASAVCSAFGQVSGDSKTVALKPFPNGGISYTYIPFDVPEKSKVISIEFEYEKKGGRNRLEFGLFDPSFSGNNSDKTGFRGWSGSVRDSVFVSPSKSTHGFVNGPVIAGKWWIIVGLASVEDEGVDLKLRIRFDQIEDTSLNAFKKEESKKFRHSKYNIPKRIDYKDLNWYRGDLHGHTFHSDGSWSVKALLDSALANHLDFVSVTDHNTYSHHPDIDKLQKKYPNLTIIRGEEVTTYGAHINVWGLPSGEWIDFRVRSGLAESGRQIVDEAHKLGALASINHPLMDCSGCRWTYGSWETADSVEVWNATWDEIDEKALFEWDRLLQQGKRITAVGSSDSHQPPYEASPWPTNLEIGKPAVFVQAANNSQEAILDGIRKGRVSVAADSQKFLGFLIDGANQGESIVIKKDKKATFDCFLNGFDKEAVLKIILNGKVIHEKKVGTDRRYLNGFFVEQNGYFRAEVRNPDGTMAAFTNPVWMVVGD